MSENKNEMSPEQALKLLDNVTSQLSLNRKDHFQILKALETLKALVTKSQ